MPFTTLDPSVQLDPASTTPKFKELPKDVQLDAPKSESTPSIGGRLLHGFEAPLVGLDTLASRIEQHLPFIPKATAATDVAVAEKQQAEFERRPEAAGGVPGFVGNVLNPLNWLGGAAAKGAGLASTLGHAALAGAESSAVQPSPTGDDYWSKKLHEVETGAAAGAAGAGLIRGVGRAVAPVMSSDAAQLAARDVSLTPGQMGAGGGMVGRQIRRLEESFKSFPILGAFIRGAEGRSIESFDRATINQAMEPIGKKLPKGIEAGHESVDYAAKKISDAYNSILPHVNFQVDRQLLNDVIQMRQFAPEMPPAQAAQFDAILKNRIFARLSSTADMDGRTFKQVESELRALALPYQRSGDAAQRQLGHVLNDVRGAMRDALARQNPMQAKELQNINAAYAMLTRVENAASRRLGGTGVFTPLDLLSAIRSGDLSARKRAFAHGDALLQGWADAAQRILPSKMADSGTPERLGYIAGTLGLLEGGHGFGIPGSTEAAIAAAAAALPYTRIGQQALNVYAKPGATRQAIARAIAEAARYGGAPAAMATAPQPIPPATQP